MSDLGGRGKVKKTTVEECWSLDACSLAKEGVFTCHGVWASSLTWSNSFGEQTLYVPYWVQKLQGEPILHHRACRHGRTDRRESGGNSSRPRPKTSVIRGFLAPHPYVSRLLFQAFPWHVRFSGERVPEFLRRVSCLIL